MFVAVCLIDLRLVCLCMFWFVGLIVLFVVNCLFVCWFSFMFLFVACLWFVGLLVVCLFVDTFMFWFGYLWLMLWFGWFNCCLLLCLIWNLVSVDCDTLHCFSVFVLGAISCVVYLCLFKFIMTLVYVWCVYWMLICVAVVCFDVSFYVWFRAMWCLFYC